MGGGCSTRGRDEKYIYIILVGKHDGKNHSEDLGVDAKVIFKWILGK